ncbi:hypothetical protein QBC39DRAFT_23638 [Podospora conica]|nr:hypothetical protein QBC39DRAFT_23638 [Schizothecium conicum]
MNSDSTPSDLLGVNPLTIAETIRTPVVNEHSHPEILLEALESIKDIVDGYILDDHRKRLGMEDKTSADLEQKDSETGEEHPSAMPPCVREPFPSLLTRIANETMAQAASPVDVPRPLCQVVSTTSGQEYKGSRQIVGNPDPTFVSEHKREEERRAEDFVINDIRRQEAQILGNPDPTFVSEHRREEERRAADVRRNLLRRQEVQDLGRKVRELESLEVEVARLQGEFLILHDKQRLQDLYRREEELGNRLFHIKRELRRKQMPTNQGVDRLRARLEKRRAQDAIDRWFDKAAEDQDDCHKRFQRAQERWALERWARERRALLERWDLEICALERRARAEARQEIGRVQDAINRLFEKAAEDQDDWLKRLQRAQERRAREIWARERRALLERWALKRCALERRGRAEAQQEIPQAQDEAGKPGGKSDFPGSTPR